jgi:hypothetical protein
MLKKYKQLLTSNQVAGEVKHDQFYTDENVNGYMSKKEMLAYSRALTTGQQDQQDLFFEYTAEGFSISSLPIASEDKETGETVIWTSFKLPKAPQNFRMIYHPGILRFIKEYQQGKIKPSFTYDQLIEEALKIEEPAS